jgi:hypothetical protein
MVDMHIPDRDAEFLSPCDPEVHGDLDTSSTVSWTERRVDTAGAPGYDDSLRAPPATRSGG